MTCQTNDFPCFAQALRAEMDYAPETGEFRWRDSGALAGCRRPDGYTVIGFHGRLYLAHRLAWTWMTQERPPRFIDHCNRIKGDDRWINLRPATMSQNAVNAGVRSSNRSGAKGVSWCRTTRKWRATITVNGRQRNLGRYARVEDAADAYQRAAAEAFGDFAA